MLHQIRGRRVRRLGQRLALRNQLLVRAEALRDGDVLDGVHDVVRVARGAPAIRGGHHARLAEQRAATLDRCLDVRLRSCWNRSRCVCRLHTPRTFDRVNRGLRPRLDGPIEGRLPGQGLHVHVCAPGDQHTNDIDVLAIAGDREHQRRHAPHVGHVDADAGVEQRLDKLGGCQRRDNRQRRPVAQGDGAGLHFLIRAIARARLRVGALREQHADGVEISAGGSLNQRSESREVSRIHVRSCGDDQPDRLGVVAYRRRVQTIGLRRVDSLRVGACLEEQPHDCRGAIAARSQLKRRAPALRCDVHVRAASHEQAHLLNLGDRPPSAPSRRWHWSR